MRLPRPSCQESKTVNPIVGVTISVPTIQLTLREDNPQHPAQHDRSAMPGAQYGERGGGLRASALSDDFDAASIGGVADPPVLPTSSSPRHVHFPPGHFQNSSGSSSTIQSLTSASTLDSKLDLSPSDAAARKGMLRETFFPTWQDDAGGADLDNPEEMQKKDPLATQIWRLYSKTKSQLPNSERMENLTWRMMSMNLRRQQLERKGFVSSLFLHPADFISLSGMMLTKHSH